MSAQDFDIEYRRLRENGSSGWGGGRYLHRRDGWQSTLTSFGPMLGLQESPLRILELGCGNGMVSGQLAEIGHQVSGVDISSVAIEWAQEQYATLRLETDFHVADACDLALFKCQEFDTVIDGNCLHCVFGDDRHALLSEAYRVLKVGGRFLVSSMCGPPRSTTARRSFDPETRCLMKNARPWRFLATSEGLIEECENASFKVLETSLNENAWWDHLVLLLQRT